MSINFKSLKLNKKSSSIEELFYTITKERLGQLSKSLIIIQNKLYTQAKENDSLNGHDLLKTVLFSDIAKTDEEFLFLVITISLLVGENAGRIKVLVEGQETMNMIMENIKLGEGGKKVD